MALHGTGTHWESPRANTHPTSTHLGRRLSLGGAQEGDSPSHPVLSREAPGLSSSAKPLPSTAPSPLLSSTAPGQPVALLMSPEKGAAAAGGGGEVRGQCNIYSDVTFHFHKVGKRCRSRKRAVRDVPVWEVTVTPRTTHNWLQRARARLRQGPPIRPSDPPNHTGLRMGSGLFPPLLPSEAWPGLGRTSEEHRASQVPCASGDPQPARSPAHNRAVPPHRDFNHNQAHDAGS